VVLPWWIVLVHFSCRSGVVSLAEMKKWFICLRGGCAVEKMENDGGATIECARCRDNGDWMQSCCHGFQVRSVNGTSAVVTQVLRWICCRLAAVWSSAWCKGRGVMVAGNGVGVGGGRLDVRSCSTVDLWWNRGGRRRDWRLGWRCHGDGRR